MFKNKKQIFIRSWTVAELVALTDMTQYALNLSEFLAEQGLLLVPPVLMQDNQSVLKIVASNGKTLPNKHMRIRQADMKEIVKQKEATLLYLPTQKMIADILTKPLQGELFRALAFGVL